MFSSQSLPNSKVNGSEVLRCAEREREREGCVNQDWLSVAKIIKHRRQMNEI
jgi:hypothetical protein